MTTLVTRFVKDAGDPREERIVLWAKPSGLMGVLNLGDFLIADTTYHDNETVSNKLRHVYWFPDYEVKPGDLVILYTREGDEFSSPNSDGTRSHFFYWGLGRPVWNEDSDSAVLIKIAEWSAARVMGGTKSRQPRNESDAIKIALQQLG